MKVLDRYIAGVVIKHSLLVLIAVILLRTLFAFIDDSGDIGKGDYELVDSIFFVVLQIPANIYDFFPVAALIGGLIGMGRLASQSELVIMRSAGLSLGQISRSVLMGTLALMFIVIFIGEAISPKNSASASWEPPFKTLRPGYIPNNSGMKSCLTARLISPRDSGSTVALTVTTRSPFRLVIRRVARPTSTSATASSGSKRPSGVLILTSSKAARDPRSASG